MRVFIVILISFVAPFIAAAQQAEDELTGMWSYQTSFGPIARGELTVTRRGSQWRATLAGEETIFKANEGAIRFALAGGRFRGTMRGRNIEGFWIRPGVTSDPRYPGGSSQAFATPVMLRRTSLRRWRGEVRPLEDPFTLYLRIFRDEEGRLLGAFRNPDQNSNGGATRFLVTRDGDKVRFAVSDDLVVEGTLAGSDRLRIFWRDLNGTIELQRRTPDQAANFFPRPPSEKTYVYHRPPALNDGWETARAADGGMDEAALMAIVQRIIDSDPAARRASLIHSLLVAHRGKLVLEEYFFGFDRETPHDVRSAGKTFASIMLGTAMRAAVPISPDSRVYEVMHAAGPFANPDPRKAQITLSHLMTHTSGLACDDNDDDSPGNENRMQMQREQPNYWKYTLDLPMAHDPGARYAYCSGNMNLAGSALATATRTWLPEWFDRTIARPLQFSPYHWNLQPDDEGYLGGGSWLRPRDLLKIGQLYLDGGVWRGRRVVDESWVKESTAQRVSITPATTGLTEEQFGEFYGGGDDALAWHLGATRPDGPRDYAATGNGGQVLIVIPAHQIAVVFTGGNYRQGGIWGRWGSEIVDAGILRALQPEGTSGE